MAKKLNKEKTKSENELYLNQISQQDNIHHLHKGLLYEILNKGVGKSPNTNNVVTVFYKGTLTNGKTFDDNTNQGYPDAFRFSELIEGWQIALYSMKEGDKWRIYLPPELGYGSRGTVGIPKNSILIFEIELVSVV